MADEQTIKRYRELAERSARTGIYIYTDFHSPAGAALSFSVTDEDSVGLWGGYEGAERVMVRFGDPASIGYKEDYPISILHIYPKQFKFADKLTHRDYLGALMNLGMERDVIGDICVYDKEAYVFVCERIASVIAGELTSVKHTSVICDIVQSLPDEYRPMIKNENVIVSSLRIDGMIAHLYHMSRNDTKAVFAAGEVFINGRLCVSPRTEPKDGDVISVRGHGKFKYDGVDRMTSKERYSVRISRYV